VVTRGEIWWVDFGEPTGSQPGYLRPAVVISSDRYNRSRINTVTVAAVTSNTRLAHSPGNIALPEDLLPKPSVINVTAIVTVNRTQLLEPLAVVPALEQHALDDGLRLAFDL
jgi:mRNA interferase MazF